MIRDNFFPSGYSGPLESLDGYIIVCDTTRHMEFSPAIRTYFNKGYKKIYLHYTFDARRVLFHMLMINKAANRLCGYIVLHNGKKTSISSPKDAKNNDLFWTLMDYPLYSPDLSPCDGHMFGHLEAEAERHKFDNNAVVETFVRNWSETWN